MLSTNGSLTTLDTRSMIISSMPYKKEKRIQTQHYHSRIYGGKE